MGEPKYIRGHREHRRHRRIYHSPWGRRRQRECRTPCEVKCRFAPTYQNRGYQDRRPTYGGSRPMYVHAHAHAHTLYTPRYAPQRSIPHYTQNEPHTHHPQYPLSHYHHKHHSRSRSRTYHKYAQRHNYNHIHKQHLNQNENPLPNTPKHSHDNEEPHFQYHDGQIIAQCYQVIYIYIYINMYR